MATTSPDNLYSPDSSDPYALTQDLGAMQDSVQTALVRRANAYVGTSAQRNAFTTAPVGTIWSDTNGNREVWKWSGSEWGSLIDLSGRAPFAMAAGRVSTPASGVATVTLPAGRFSQAPLITATTADLTTLAIPWVRDHTTTSFTVRTFNYLGTQVAGTVDWVAVQMTQTSASG